MPSRSATQQVSSHPPKSSPVLLFWNLWGLFGASAVLVGGLGYYLTRVAPALLPVPPGVKVPFPAAMPFLEALCSWCGEHPFAVVLVGAASVLLGVFSKSPRYNFWLAILAGGALAFAYLSISAPVERLLRNVEAVLPEPREVPDFLPGDVRHGRR